MRINEIIKAVRWCIDEEAVNMANLGASAYDFDGGKTDTGLMNRIITSKIGDALRWVCLYAPAELLVGTDTAGTSTGTMVEVDRYDLSSNNNRIELPANFIKLVRVRGNTWYRAVSGRSLILEDSEDYLKLHDDTSAFATEDRPQAALIEKVRKELEVWPIPDYVEYTCITSPEQPTIDPENFSETTVAIPPLAKTSFIYYLAFLLLSAYNDNRAEKMLGIAKMNLGRTDG